MKLTYRFYDCEDCLISTDVKETFINFLKGKYKEEFLELMDVNDGKRKEYVETYDNVVRSDDVLFIYEELHSCWTGYGITITDYDV